MCFCHLVCVSLFFKMVDCCGIQEILKCNGSESHEPSNSSVGAECYPMCAHKDDFQAWNCTRGRCGRQCPLGGSRLWKIHFQLHAG